MTAPLARAGQAPGVIKVRLTGSSGDVETAAALLAGAAGLASGLDLIEVSRPYANRREPGERVYLTFRLAIPNPPQGSGSSRRAPALPPRRPLQ